ncbi:MAG TPA: efflux RND transporter periplasmic adaptor subunit [Dokdonella sp.]|uniref:efflux RND transporter periplasmic adaptor subunit n=1 Tax=Dokdonella sp. TaxID=2291710 RepID=UPI0025C01ACE|nr:efflux RND transporter periplasmic adaptor subunit [Dokdonella sp.]MBX3691225.1 efflux RND transporter periplasmic adaptor subunit [Dokdonella sp.]MCW5569178.1 efflux RND transporter periplasmic adaptor subunit [Dokdonella sp.]HNR91581.1 efflux RND transporter periplasmic adaptor subunit [Dokdonella sp.]
MHIRTQRLVRSAILVVVAIALALLAKAWLFPAKAEASHVSAPVTLADIEDTVIATGELEARNLVSVGAQVSGRVVSLKVDVGDVVSAGQLIAEIDSLPQQNTLRNAEAAMQTTQAQRVARAAALRQAELAFKRQQDMMVEEATSRAEYEAAEAALATTRADVAALDAQLAQARIQVDTARLNLGYTKITAPIDGTIVAVVTKEGQTVNANQSAPTIVKLAQLDTLTVKAQISEADVPKVKAGQKVWFTILGEPDRRYYAELRAVEPAPESIASESSASSASSSSSTAIYYNGLFDVPNPEGRLRIAMTAQVNIVLAEAKDALVVPSSALGAPQRDESQAQHTPRAGGEGVAPQTAGGPQRARGGSDAMPRRPRGDAANGGLRSVRVLKPDGSVETRNVRVGINNNVNAQILEGVQEGERVVTGTASAAASAAARQPGVRMRPPMGF